ncbi:MAG TPA: hypothetical protein VF167_09490 [Longimicrobiaceae bacterium]
MADGMFSITVDKDAVERALKDFPRQTPFALALGITNTLKDAQRAVQKQLDDVFTLRGTQRFFYRAVKLTLATKSNPNGNIRIEGPETITGPDARIAAAILRHEEGGAKTSRAVYRGSTRNIVGGFFLPAKGLRTSSAGVPRALYPKNIGAQLRRDATGKKFLASNQKGRKRRRGQAGRERSYFVTARGIYERRHFGATSAIRLIWAFEPRIRLRPRLGFYRTVQRVIDVHLQPNMTRAIDHAIKTAFP